MDDIGGYICEACGGATKRCAKEHKACDDCETCKFCRKNECKSCMRCVKWGHRKCTRSSVCWEKDVFCIPVNEQPYCKGFKLSGNEKYITGTYGYNYITSPDYKEYTFIPHDEVFSYEFCRDKKLNQSKLVVVFVWCKSCFRGNPKEYDDSMPDEPGGCYGSKFKGKARCRAIRIRGSAFCHDHYKEYLPDDYKPGLVQDLNDD